MMTCMHATHIGRVDLNLLPALIALLEERHVSRAAVRVGMSQPAMSRSLHRLRRTLGDDLLVRTPEGYRLTPRGERILDRLATAVPQLEDVFAGAEFDPSTTELEMRVAGSDYAQAVIGPGLSSRVATASPGSTLRFRPWHRDVLAELSDGVLDLAFIGAQTPEPLRREELFSDRFVCVVSAGHPLADRPALGLAEYLGCRHLIIDLVDGRQPAIDRVLSARGTPRRAGLILPVHATATLALPGTDLVLTMPQRLVGHYASGEALRVLRAPDEIGTMTYWMAWHPRLDRDPVHRWLRDGVRETAAGLR